MKLRKIIELAGIISLIFLFYQAVEGQQEFHPDRYDAFLCMLAGSWKGNATITPVGPRPYDITFVFDDSKRLAGASRPGSVSTHYWTFFVKDNILKLKFLSTFAGNRQPIYLTANAEEAGKWFFNTDDVNFLEVRVHPQKRTTRIQIYIRGEHHVEIELTRPG
jgi:hypothetical protein